MRDLPECIYPCVMCVSLVCVKDIRCGRYIYVHVISTGVWFSMVTVCEGVVRKPLLS